MSEFIKSVQVTIDGPKVPFHFDSRSIADGTKKWFVVDNDMLEHKGPYDTWMEAQVHRDTMNKEFRDSGQSKP